MLSTSLFSPFLIFGFLSSASIALSEEPFTNGISAPLKPYFVNSSLVSTSTSSISSLSSNMSVLFK